MVGEVAIEKNVFVDNESYVQRTEKVIEDVRRLIIENEPGFPPMKHVKKSSFVRALVADDLLELVGHKKEAKRFGDFHLQASYDGLDAELWIERSGEKPSVQCVLLKRQGFKEMNSAMSHGVTNKVRDNILLSLDNELPDIERSKQVHNLGDEELGKYLVNTIYLPVVEEERKLIEASNKDQKIPYVMRVACSQRISVADTNIDSCANAVEQARLQANLEVKRLQLESMQVDSPMRKDTFGMTSMLRAVSGQNQKEELTELMKRVLGERRLSSNLLRNNEGEIYGETGIYNPSEVGVNSELNTELHGFSPDLAQALQEVYKRPVLDLARQEVREDGMRAVAEEIDGMEKGVERDDLIGLYQRENNKMVRALLSDPEHHFYVNKALAKFQLEEAIKNNDWVWVLNTDREATLLLNAKLGVDRVDNGFDRQSVIANETIRGILSKLRTVYPELRIRGSYCRKNADENMIVLTMEDIYKNDPKAGQIERAKIEEFLSRELGQMDKRMNDLPDLKIDGDGEAYDSHSAGFWMFVPAGDVLDYKQAISVCDSLSEMYKTTRKIVMSHLPRLVDTKIPKGLLLGQVVYSRDQYERLSIKIPGNKELLENEQTLKSVQRVILAVKEMFNDGDKTVKWEADYEDSSWHIIVEDINALANLGTYVRYKGAAKMGTIIRLAQKLSKKMSPLAAQLDQPGAVERYLARLTTGHITSYHYDEETRKGIEQDDPLVKAGLLDGLLDE